MRGNTHLVCGQPPEQRIRQIQFEEVFLRKLKSQKEKVELLKETFKQQENTIAVMDKQICLLKSQNTQLSVMLQALQNQFHLSFQYCNRLKDQLRQSQNLLAKERSALDQSRRALQLLKEQSNKEIRRCQENIRQNSEHTKKAEEGWKQALARKQQQTMMLRQKVRKIQTENKKISQNEQSLKDLLSQINIELKVMRSELSKKQGIISQLNNKVREASFQMSVLTKQQDQAKLKLKSSQIRIQQQQAQKRTMLRRLQQVQHQMRNFINQSNKDTQYICRLQQEIEGCLTELKHSKSQNAVLKKSKEELQRIIEECQSRNKDCGKMRQLKRQLMDKRQKEVDHMDSVFDSIYRSRKR